MKKILITGAAGFIGKYLVEKLAVDNEVYAVVLPDEVDKLNNLRCHVISGNLEDVGSIEPQLNGIKLDMIYHLAWIGVSTDYKNNYDLQMRNLKLAINVMEIAKMHECKRIISTGSVSEYAYYDGAIDGTQVPAPCDAYSATKSAIHIYCDLFARQNDLNFYWVLIPSIYGPGRNDNNLITYSIKKLLAGEKPSFTKLEQKWDYIYITDLIEALWLIGKNGIGNKTYPVGTGTARSMAEYVGIIRDSINPKAELGIGDLPYKTKRIDNAIVDISKTMEDTGYMPKVTFEQGIRETIEYFRKLVD